jgi:mannose-1-phosphate guanylyltransferase
MMRYAVILAGGSGTRLWPMSRERLPKQLIPFMDGKSLLAVAYRRIEGLVPEGNRYVCGNEAHRDIVRNDLPGLAPARFIGEPEGRDTLNALAYSCAVLNRIDPDAVVAVFTADHLITPEDTFRDVVRKGYETAELMPETLVTFGISPTRPATAYGYLELGAVYENGSRRVSRFVEKPDLEAAIRYTDAGPDRYLWNSGMFVWRAKTFLECVRRFVPDSEAAFDRISEAWGTSRFGEVVGREYPALRKISVDFAVMQPASTSAVVSVASLPMAVDWMDIGSWPAYGLTRRKDGNGNTQSAERHIIMDSKDCLVVSEDRGHLVAVLGCKDLIVIHTGDATLVCSREHAEDIKKLRAEAEARFGPDYT